MYKHVFQLCFYFLLGFLLIAQPSVAQPASSDLLPLKNGISKPNTLATHPFGVLFYTLPHNFKMRPANSKSFAIQLSGGNVWGQPVTTLIPTLTANREELKNLQFFDREFAFNPENSPFESFQIAYDGVIKDLRLGITLPAGEKSDITVSARSFWLTRGTLPFSIFTGDQFIEFFHSNFFGGEDPFKRKALGLDRARVFYLDRNKNLMDISAGEFVFSGIESAYYHYPQWLSEENIRFNLGVHLGANMSNYNSSLDMGVSVASVKKFGLMSNKYFFVGLGLNLLRKNLLGFKRNQTDLGTSAYFGSFEGHLEYTAASRSGGHHSIGLNYRIQTPYNNKAEEAYYVPTGENRRGRWHEAARHLYKFPSYWSLMYSFTKKTIFSIYLQQDMLVNNTPDFQTGISLTLPIKF